MERVGGMAIEPRRLVEYCRVSTAEQASGFSLDAQHEANEAYAKTHNALIVRTFKEVSSGTNPDRTILRDAINFCKEHAHGLIVWRLDRLGRSLNHLLQIVNELHEHNKTLIVANEGLEFSFEGSSGLGTIAGKILLTVLGLLAEMEHTAIKERVVLGKIQAVKAGRWMGGNKPPLGYKVANGKLEIDPQLAPLIRSIFLSYLNSPNSSIRALAAKFNMHHSLVRRILRNPVYTGVYRWRIGGKKFRSSHNKVSYLQMDGENVVMIKVPRIIEWEVFEAVQRKLEQQRKKWDSEMRLGWWSGLFKCAGCGNSLTRHRRSPDAPYYLCCGIKGCKEHASIRFDLAEKFLLGYLHQAFKRLREMMVEEMKGAGKSYVMSESEIRERRQTLIALFSKGYITAEELEHGLRELELQELAVKGERETEQFLQCLNALLDAEVFETAWKLTPPEWQRTLTRKTISAIIVKRNKVVEIKGLIPLTEPITLIERRKITYEDALPKLRELWQQRQLKVKVIARTLRVGTVKASEWQKKFLSEVERN